jgi:hypothetical protein
VGLVVLPKLLTSGTTAYGSDVIADFNAVLGAVNGGIDDANVKTLAGIQGSKLSNVAGSRIPADRIEDGAIVSSKLGALSVLTAAIADGAVTNPKIAAGTINKDRINPASKLTAAQVALTSGQGPIPATTRTGFGVLGATLGGSSGFASLSVTPVQVGANWQLRIVATQIVQPTGSFSYWDFNQDPNAIGIGTLPVASNLIIGAWLLSAAISVGQLTGTLYVVWIPLS